MKNIYIVECEKGTNDDRGEYKIFGEYETAYEYFMVEWYAEIKDYAEEIYKDEKTGHITGILTEDQDYISIRKEEVE